MKNYYSKLSWIVLSILLVNCGISFSQTKGLSTITEKELRYHLEFLGALEFRGRETPSPELEIATLYLGNWAKDAGLKPILKDGSFYQTVPITVTAVSQPNTKIRISRGNGERFFSYGKSFGGNFSGSGSYSGTVVFTGLGLSNPEKGWDDLKDLNLSGKVVLIMDEQLPASGPVTSSRLSARIAVIRNKGAAAVFSILSPEREAKGFKTFEKIPAGRMGTLYDSQRTSFGPPAARTTPQAVSPASQAPPTSPTSPTSQASQTTQTAPVIPPRPSLPFGQAEISHELAADILGISIAEVGAMFDMVKEGKQVPSKTLSEVRVQLDVKTESYPSTSRSVIGIIEGTDPVLKNEYIVVSGHHDHLGISNGEIMAGADDNATASVALIEIAQALLVERPKRSVIIAWFTGEEKGLNGSHYFVNNCPVPVEKISTCLNMDMLGRNNADSLFLVGSDLISSELDAAINKVNKQSKINFGFSYVYSNLTHPSSVYTRSDHYPFIRFGIPSVWFFCGFTPDYHTPKDVLEFIDYKKFFKITKLVYLTAFETANKMELLKLDVNPAVTSRGKHNLTERSLFRAPGR